MKFQREKYRDNDGFDPLFVLPCISVSCFIFLIFTGMLQPFNVEGIEKYYRDKEQLLTGLLIGFLYSTWGSCVYLFAINADWEDFRVFLRGKGDGELI